MFFGFMLRAFLFGRTVEDSTTAFLALSPCTATFAFVTTSFYYNYLRGPDGPPGPPGPVNFVPESDATAISEAMQIKHDPGGGSREMVLPWKQQPVPTDKVSRGAAGGHTKSTTSSSR